MAATAVKSRDTSHDLFPLDAPVRCGVWGEIGKYRGFARQDGDTAVHRVRVGTRTYRYVTEASLTPLYRLIDAGGLLKRFEPITLWDDWTDAMDAPWSYL